jgi:hypothetical protein
VPSPLVPLRVSEIGEFNRFQGCERRFKLGLNNRRLARSLISEHLFNALDPVLQEVGQAAEDGWEKALRADGLRDLSRAADRAVASRARRGVVPS